MTDLGPLSACMVVVIGVLAYIGISLSNIAATLEDMLSAMRNRYEHEDDDEEAV